MSRPDPDRCRPRNLRRAGSFGSESLSRTTPIISVTVNGLQSAWSANYEVCRCR